MMPKTKKPPYAKFVKKSEAIERLRLVGPMDEYRNVLNSLHADRFRVTTSGPFPITVGRVDPNRFLLYAERAISS